MKQIEIATLRGLLNAAKGARDTLMRMEPQTPPGVSRAERDIRRLARAIAEAEALLDHERAGEALSRPSQRRAF